MQHHSGWLHRGYWVPEADLRAVTADLSAMLRRNLVITYVPNIGPPKRTQLWEVARAGGVAYLILPRLWLYTLVYVQQVLLPPRVILPPIARIDCEYIGELDDNQQIVVDHLLAEHFNAESIERGCAAALLNMRAGLGKTFIAAAIIGALRLRTLYVVVQENLRVQAIDDMRPVLRADIGEYVRGKPRDVDIIIVNTAERMSERDIAPYSLVIYDEVHKLASEQRRKTLRRTMTWVNLGMSATVSERADMLDPVYHKELALRGVVVADDLPGFNAADRQFYIDVEIINYYGAPEYTAALVHPSTGKVFTPWIQKQLIADPTRMTIIADRLSELYREVDAEGRPVHCIYVFCEERDQLGDVFTALQRLHAERGYELYAPEIEKYYGGRKTADIRRIVDTCRVFLSTYGYATLGVSVCKMTAIIFATPRKAGMVQAIGRICRRNGDPAVRRKIIDIVDKNTPLWRQSRVRMDAYLTKDKPVLDANGAETGEQYLTITYTDVHSEAQ